MLENTLNQPSKFRTKNWVKVSDDVHGMYNTKNQIEFKTSTLKPSLCDYSDAYILVSGIITITGAEADDDDDGAKGATERNKEVMFKHCTPFTDCISEINNTQIDNAKDIDVVIPIYNLIEYSDNYSKTSGSLCQYYRDEPSDQIVNSKSFESKIKIT